MPAKSKLSHAHHGLKGKEAESKFMDEYQRHLSVFAFYAVI